VQEADRATQDMIDRTKLRESEIAQQWAKAQSEGDQDAVQAAREALQRWNEDNPDTPIRIKPGDILKRVKKMREDRATRIEHSAPREVRQEAKRMLAD
jgi:hypothetical protein